MPQISHEDYIHSLLRSMSPTASSARSLVLLSVTGPRPITTALFPLFPVVTQRLPEFSFGELNHVARQYCIVGASPLRSGEPQYRARHTDHCYVVDHEHSVTPGNGGAFNRDTDDVCDVEDKRKNESVHGHVEYLLDSLCCATRDGLALHMPHAWKCVSSSPPARIQKERSTFHRTYYKIASQRA